jgi:hypothetical protein
MCIYRVSQKECARLLEGFSYVKTQELLYIEGSGKSLFYTQYASSMYLHGQWNVCQKKKTFYVVCS